MKHVVKKAPKRRKLILPVIFLIFILSIVGLKSLGKLSFDLDLSLLTGNKMVSPEVKSSQVSILQDQLSKYDLAAKEIKISKDAVEFKVSGVRILFNPKGDIPEQVVSLQFILSRAKMEGKIPHNVDLRFAKPVVSY